MLRLARVSSFVALAFVTLSAPASEMTPFVLPYDDAFPDITDSSALNYTPAGKRGYIAADAQGSLAVNCQRYRLYGVNITAASCFPTHQEAEKAIPRSTPTFRPSGSARLYPKA